MYNITIFASGTGSNARKIVEHFKTHPDIRVNRVVSNRQTAAVLEMAATHGITTQVIKRSYFYDTQDILQDLADTDLIVLAGFLWLIPAYFVQAFPNKIINIHPALLPKYGGKGMYGMNVHRAVEAAGEHESGISIHYVNEHYDEGQIIFQASCALEKGDDASVIATKVLALEHQHFAPVIEQLLLKIHRS
ncbi:MAG: phosphoribosylglycinamide formyltransferase [Bacteroidota bacterium]